MTFTGPASVVIAACNEERVIGDTLRTLLADAEPGEFDVVVACNGCLDGTADVARRSHPSVRVVETETAGKTAALNLGDRLAEGFPRIYADADIVMDTTSLRATLAALGGEICTAAPRLIMGLDGASWAVRQYFAMWSWLRAKRGDLQGSGVYALSEAGRARFDAFPEIIADDLFAYGLFSSAERLTVESAIVRVSQPTTLRALISVKSRVFVGKLQYRSLYGAGSHGFGHARRLRALYPLPVRLWCPGIVYAGVQVVAKVRAQRRFRRGELHAWNRDDTSRAGVGPSQVSGTL